MPNDELLKLLQEYRCDFLPRDGYGIDMAISAEDAAYLERIERDVKRLCALVAEELASRPGQ